ncbi:MAG: DUF2975 domain-containing protein [Brevundimonas sp.]|uniref:DUF2975 domain-containing protein n=1 Tax=Brevundimonas sp. TaxID=1871086 RepID=UPI00271CC98C|nr:DUF2975 domain-containing protein [Brevundimonas sp.]MDZ4319401.1 DUF2975 domain-containing protein [Phenylobacterium sp.]MDO9588901.1 DUF2975 domain-containing protein [Brevundimonas sp.]MDP3369410.1 DUF2975 domain-containing protein [Brevundimonas sp.]MDP3658061.1 DUF2975 domain-containing protein [Brevundimonas sp.]MDZ4111306.1 DUF2975 domain-containing protein [Brevundimonas sp.]
MRFPKRFSLGIRVPAVPGLRTRSMSRLLNPALGAAYWLMILLTAIVLIAFVVTIFLPMGPTGLIFRDESGGTEIPVSRAYILFGFGAFVGYFGGFALILRQLRLIFRTLASGDPFHPTNVSRLKQIGLTLAVITGGAWIGQSLVARLARGEMGAPSLFDLVTPAFSVLVVFVLAEVFREGARLRRESELTI